jgi:hypothetical protein
MLKFVDQTTCLERLDVSSKIPVLVGKWLACL